MDSRESRESREIQPLPEDVWDLLKQYMFQDKFRAIAEVRRHTALPYALSLHQFKGLDNTLAYLQRREPWVFRLLPFQQVKNIILETQLECRD